MRSLRSVFVIPRCGICGKAVVPGNVFCDRCDSAAERIVPPLCIKCGRGMDRCVCRGGPGIGIKIAAPFYYEGNIKSAMLGIKNGDFYRIESLSAECAKTVMDRYPRICFDMVTYVPMHKKKERRKGYNHSELIAKRVAKELGIPISSCLVKTRDTPEQHTMPMSGRKANVFGIYEVKQNAKIIGKTILLIDDIITTGSTVEEISDILKLSGANRIYAAAIALTPPKEKL